MKRNKSSRNIIKKRKRLTTNAQPSSPYHLVLRSLRRLDRNIFVFFILIIAFLYFGNNISLNMKMDWPAEFQIQRLNPDAKLYYSLAENIVDGKGYYDTYRKKEVMPPIGHPLLLAICCVIGGMSPAQFSWLFLFVSFVFLGLGVRIYTKSNVCVLLALWLYGSFFSYRWLSGNIESSIAFSNTLLFLSLACLYRSKFNTLLALISGLALALSLLIRPMYLFPTHFFFLVLLVIIIYHYARKRGTALPSFAKGWFILLATTEIILLLTHTYSNIKYKDSRLVTGTYGAWALYAGNNIHIPPVGKYNSRKIYSKEFLELKALMGQRAEARLNQGKIDMAWKERRKLLMGKVIDYWKSHPLRALHGWWWRFRQFLGIWSGEFSFRKPLTVFHTFSVSVLLILVPVRMIFAGKIDREKLSVTGSLGLILAALFLLYVAMRAMFQYADFRYVMNVIPLFVIADVLLLFEIRHLLRKTALNVMSYLQPTKAA